MDTPKLLPPRWWWLVLFALILCAGLLRLTGYNFSLPYIDHPDEPNFNIAAQMIIDMGTSKSMHYQGYPPGIVTLNYLFLRFFHDPTTPPGTIIWMIRLLAIVTSLALMLVIGLLGRCWRHRWRGCWRRRCGDSIRLPSSSAAMPPPTSSSPSSRCWRFILCWRASDTGVKAGSLPGFWRT